MEKISIIIPVYGVEKYIKKCLDSIVNQTYTNLEIIIVDDGTKDNSIKIIEDNFSDTRIKIYHQKNGGQAKARNYGLTKATGKYLFFVDSDDYIENDCIEKMYQKLIHDKVDMVMCDYYKLYEDERKEAIKIIPHYEKDNLKCSVISMPTPCCKLIKKDYFLKYNIKFLEGHYFEDNAIMPFLCAVIPKFSYLEEPLYYYLQRNGSSLHKEKYDKKWEDIFKAFEHLLLLFKKNNLEKDFYDEIEYLSIEYFLHAPSLRFIKYSEGINNIKKINIIMKEKFPYWYKNKYFQKENIKYKIICNLFYNNHLKLAKMLLRK